MRLTVCGDISVIEGTPAWEAFEKGDLPEIFGGVTSVFNNSDRVLVNLECALTDSDKKIDKIGPAIRSPKAVAKVLRNAGVTDCGLSNNHIFDYGRRGVRDTVAELEEAGLNYTGFGANEEDSRRDLIITDGKVRVAIIAVCEHEYSYALDNRMGARPYDPYDTNDDILRARQNADYVIVTYHGGKEHCRYPSPRLLKACRSMIKHGANVVLCQHSHCVGCYEEYMGGHILYGQGNFHFVWDTLVEKCNLHDTWNNGLVAVLDLENGVKINFIPTVVRGAGIDLARGDEAREILSEFAKRNEELKSGEWRERWRECALGYGGYDLVPDELAERFAHYLDCEAHTDVWREKYHTKNHENELSEV